MHWSLCGNSSKEILRKLDVEVEKKEERSVTFFDLRNPDETLKYHSLGIVLRVRSDLDKQGSSTVKVKVKSTEDFIESGPLSNEEKYKCEEDRYREKISYFCSLSSESRLNGEEIFSENQKIFFKKKTFENLDFQKLQVFGPFTNFVWVFSRSKGFVLEEVRLPDSTSFYELSLRVPLDEAEKRFQENLDFLQKKNIHLCEIQESKTLKILNFFKNKKY